MKLTKIIATAVMGCVLHACSALGAVSVLELSRSENPQALRDALSKGLSADNEVDLKSGMTPLGLGQFS
jgi:hypothetical protein